MSAKNQGPAKPRSLRVKKPITLLPIAEPPRGARTYLWVGVLTISLLVLGLWAWSLKLQLTFFEWKNVPEQNFWQQTKSTWDDLFKPKPQTLTKEQLTDNLKNAFQKIQLQALGATSTENVATTTEAEINATSTPSTTQP